MVWAANEELMAHNARLITVAFDYSGIKHDFDASK